MGKNPHMIRKLLSCLFVYLVLLPGTSGFSRQGPQGEQDGKDDPAAESGPMAFGGILPPGEGGIRISAGPGSVLQGEELHLIGYVDIQYGHLRLQADSVLLNRETRDCVAEGNVVIDTGDVRITAASAEINLDTGLGTFLDARVTAEPSLKFEAERMERIAVDRFLIEKGEFTSCSQATPYWSFGVGRGLIHLEHYAYLHNISFRVNGIPTLYSPYLVWPIKEDRATGLLIPEIGYSQSRGPVLNLSYFWAMRRNMDATFYLDIFGDERAGAGLEYRFVPNALGSGRFAGYYQREQLTDEGRWFVGYREDQMISPRTRLLADINLVSDSDYYLNFERDLGIGTNPSALSRVFTSWNGAVHSLNTRLERREQFSVNQTLEQAVLPEVELRGRQRQIGATPLIFSFQTSGSHFLKETSTFDADYGRLDLFPSISAPFSPAPWLQVEPTLNLRGTYYSQSLPGGVLSDEDLYRGFVNGTLDILGPRFARIYRAGRPKKYRHTVEPRLTYVVTSRSDNAADVILFDEIDTLQGNRNQILYSLTTRLFSKRTSPVEGTSTQGDQTRDISSLTISQSYSFSDPLSASTQLNDDSFFSPVRLNYRFNPTMNAAINFNSTYDILFHKLSAVGLSATLRQEGLGFVDFSWFQQKSLGTKFETNQIRLVGEGNFFNQKLLLGVQTNYNIEASRVQDQRYLIGYNTQCCGFAVEWFQREFIGIDEEEIRFQVSLKGVGTVVDFHTGTAVGQQALY
jgi:lipopolysaccharide assembly outer membrane protein LptD (OstA)